MVAKSWHTKTFAVTGRLIDWQASVGSGGMQREMRAAAFAVGVVLGRSGSPPAAAEAPKSSTTTAATETGTATTAAGGDPVAGREVFISTGCGKCHTLQEAGTDGAVGPNLDEGPVPDAAAAGAPLAEYIRTSIVDPDSWVMPMYSSGVMPTGYGSQLSQTQLDDLVAFIVQSAQ